ncbi:GNAT family N-acetyltransferase [Hymenobacter sp. YC55]|uniref:GNAT family N-acetyltransferase n=1 Tax=Hymenobacter sp. YC55 TaxID=3034019 RepID=UPI0023F81F6F|nr:GNAT family N-acetyltransferase [Hymenobacter sp. YC55]MDF7814665.1 GNAT family N-acetyltransferase [Hymenobacter sp. YC55]
MPPRLLRYSELDLAAWDACVAAAREVVPYACSWWLHATAGRWEASVEVEEGTGRYLSVLPLPIKWRLQGKEVYQPAFTQQLGLLTLPESQFADLLQHLRLLPKRYARLYTQLNDQTPIPPPLTPFTSQARVTYHLPLQPEYATLHAGYAADYRRRLRLSNQLFTPLTVKAAASVDEMLALFKQHSGKAAGLKSKHYQQLQTLYAALQQHNQALLLEVRGPETGELLAAALFVKFRTRLIYLFAAASPAGKKAAAPLLLLDYVIQRYAGTPELVLDFEGGMIESIARFFANFGATPVPYVALSFTQRPWYLQWIR